MFQRQSLSSQVLYSTVQIKTKEAVGTAFPFRLRSSDNQQVDVLITNNHVVAGSKQGQFILHDLKIDADGKTSRPNGTVNVEIDAFDKAWLPHPDKDIDLCVMPLRYIHEQLGRQTYYIPLTPKEVHSQSQLSHLFASEEVTMTGYPIGLYDEVNNLPLLRRGHTATHPAVDFKGKPNGVVDIASFPGSSGSPVVILNDASFSSIDGITMSSRLIFLGVLFGGPVHTTEGKIEVVNIPTAKVPITTTNIPIHLGYYIKAREVLVLCQALFEKCGLKPGWTVES